MGSKRRPAGLRSLSATESGRDTPVNSTLPSTRKRPHAALHLFADRISVDRVALVDPGGQILATNAAWNDFAAAGVVTRRRIGVGANYFDVCRLSSRTSREAVRAERGVRSVLRRSSDSFTMEYSSRTAAGLKHFLLTVLPLDLDESCACIIHSDITALKEARSIAGAIYESPTIPVGIWNADGHLAQANEAYLRLLHSSREELESGKTASFVVTPPEIAATEVAPIKKTLRSGKYALLHKEYQLRDGSRVPVLLCECQMDSSPNERIGFVIDLSAQRSAESNLRRSENALKQCTQELKALTQRMMIVQEEERRRIARELHDDVNGHIGMMAFEVRQSIDDTHTSTTSLRNHLQRLLDQILELSARVRTISHRLHSPILEHAGLVVALQSLFDEAKAKLHLTVRFTTSGDLTGIAREAVECVYRVAQECVQNIALHSGVNEALAVLEGEPDQIAFTIADRGVGFDMKADSTGLGLLSMKERVCLVGGVLEIRSRPGAGTKIRLTLPRLKSGLTKA